MNWNNGRCAGCGGALVADFTEAPDRFHGRTAPFQLLRCASCALVWLAKPPKLEELSFHYSREYDRSIAAAGDSAPQRARDRKKSLRKFKNSGTVLDLGCSSGSFLKELGSKDWELYGVEMSAESAARAQAESGATVFVGDILDAPFPTSRFDVVTCFHVFEHLYRPREVLSKVVQWLKPGGIFFVLVPNIDSAGFKIFRSYWYALELPRHVFHYSPQSLIRMAGDAGLEVESLTTHRELFIEQSARYIVTALLQDIGVRRVPLAQAQMPGIAFRIVRKAFRLSVLPILNLVASQVGDGESIHAVFRKKQG